MYKIGDINVNGKTYDWRMISVAITIDGNDYEPTGITSLTYSQTRDSQWNFGIGGRAISKGYGNTNAEATITMAAFELQNFKDALIKNPGDEGAYIQNINQFDVKVMYNFDDGSTKLDVIKDCSFNTDGGGASQNDMFIQQEINLDPSHIRFGQTVSV